MKLDALLELAAARNPTAQEMDAYCVGSGLTPEAALDGLARVVARRYAEGTLSYGAGDAVMGCAFAYGTTKGVIPDFMFSVFQAFDAGEFYPDDIRDPSPEERFTRPQIAAILAKDDAV